MSILEGLSSTSPQPPSFFARSAFVSFVLYVQRCPVSLLGPKQVAVKFQDEVRRPVSTLVPANYFSPYLPALINNLDGFHEISHFLLSFCIFVFGFLCCNQQYAQTFCSSSDFVLLHKTAGQSSCLACCHGLFCIRGLAILR